MLAHAMRSSLGFSDFFQLSLTQQTILADCLERGRAEITLPATNAYADHMCRNGWLREMPSMSTDKRTFSIPTSKWQELQTMKAQIMTPGQVADIRQFRTLNGY